jgi:hypothetical protein
MIQQVNLYRDDVVLRAPVLDARALLRALAALAGALLLASLALAVRDWLQSRSLSALQASVQENERGLAELEARHAAHSDSAALDAQLSRLEAQLRARQHLIELIRTSSANRTGFSIELEGLALGRVPGMWLDAFRFSHGGRALELHGRSLRADLVPGFVLELGRKAPFGGTEFDTLLIERPASSEALRFEIRTSVPEGAAPREDAG